MVDLVWNVHNNGKIPFDFVRRQVNNGTATKFWFDVWLGDVMLSSRFPRLSTLASNGDVYISAYWLGNASMILWRRSIVGGVLQSHLHKLMEMLDSLQPLSMYEY